MPTQRDNRLTSKGAAAQCVAQENTPQAPGLSELDRRQKLAKFFRDHRTKAGLTLEAVAAAAGIENTEILLQYETALLPIPLEDIFSLTNALNIAPEAVLTIVHDIYSRRS